MFFELLDLKAGGEANISSGLIRKMTFNRFSCFCALDDGCYYHLSIDLSVSEKKTSRSIIYEKINSRMYSNAK